MSRTPYAETELLLAIMEEREDDAERISANMTYRERDEFASQLRRAAEIVDNPYPPGLLPVYDRRAEPES